MPSLANSAGITPSELRTALNSGALKQAWITSSTAYKQAIYEAFASLCFQNDISIFTSQNNDGNTNGSNYKGTYPGALGSFDAYACRSVQYGAILLYVTTNYDAIAAYSPHTISTKLARVSLSGILATRELPLNYVDNSQPLNNASVYKNIPLAGYNQPRINDNCQTFYTNISDESCTTKNDGTTNGFVSKVNYDFSQIRVSSAVAQDANGPQLPVGGFSDVEAALFSAADGGGDVSAKGKESLAGIGQVFGVAVSNNLYRAMQAFQGITATQIANDTAFDPAIAPNITSSQYTAIIDNDNASAYKADWSLLTGAVGVGKKVYLERLKSTSGSQAASNAFFLKSPCTDANAGSLQPASVSDSDLNFIVSENINENYLMKKLKNANTSGNFAIGVMSLTNDWRVNLTGYGDEFKWLKLNGIHPESGGVEKARNTTLNGIYQFYIEGHYFLANTAGKNNSGFYFNEFPQVLSYIANALASQKRQTDGVFPIRSCNQIPRGLLINPLSVIYDAFPCTSDNRGNNTHKGSNHGNSCAPIKLLN